MVRNMIYGGAFVFMMVAVWLAVEVKHHVQKNRIRRRALEILRRKEAAKAALRKSKEDEAWAHYVFGETEGLRHDFDDDPAAG